MPNSRNKGRVAEREVVNIFRDHGIQARRLWEDQSKPGGQTDGDLEIGNGVYVEVRRRERLDIPGWLRELEEKASGRHRALIFRRSHEPWYAAIPLEWLIELLGGEV